MELSLFYFHVMMYFLSNINGFQSLAISTYKVPLEFFDRVLNTPLKCVFSNSIKVTSVMVSRITYNMLLLTLPFYFPCRHRRKIKSKLDVQKQLLMFYQISLKHFCFMQLHIFHSWKIMFSFRGGIYTKVATRNVISTFVFFSSSAFHP